MTYLQFTETALELVSRESDYNESFNVKLWDELLIGELFYILKEAKELIKQWRVRYNSIKVPWVIVHLHYRQHKAFLFNLHPFRHKERRTETLSQNLDLQWELGHCAKPGIPLSRFGL